jgi:hypothetical protein
MHGYSIGHWGRGLGQWECEAEGGGVDVRDDRDVAIVTLLLVAVTFVTILLLKLAESTGGLIELLFLRG